LWSVNHNNDGYGTPSTITQDEVLAYVLATHEDEAFVTLKGLLKPFGIIQLPILGEPMNAI
jgi:hypothetical protein